MADVASTIFNKKAAEKLRSPDDLDKFVRVTNPSVWIALVACVVFLAGLLVWGVFGAVTTSVSGVGVCVEGNAMCFVAGKDAAKIHIGDNANVGGEYMEVSTISPIPLSKGETGEILKSDYLVDTLVQDDWAYQVVFKGDTTNLADSVPLNVNITVERIAPISLILGKSE